MTVSPSMNPVQNLMVPSGGTTHAVTFRGKFNVSGQTIDWRQFKLDLFPFQPQGVYIDNSQGTTPCKVIIGGVNWTIYVEPGTQRAMPFPAPANTSATIYADPTNEVGVIFVDYPVFPDNGGLSGDINAIIPATAPDGQPYQVKVMNADDIEVSIDDATPIKVNVTQSNETGLAVKAADDAGIAVTAGSANGIDVNLKRGSVALVDFDLGTASAGSVTVNAPTGNYRLVALQIAGSPDMAAASAGLSRLQINDTAAGGQLGIDYLYLPAASATPAGVTPGYFRQFDFSGTAVIVSSLVLDLSSPITAGDLQGVAIFEEVV